MKTITNILILLTIVTISTGCSIKNNSSLIERCDYGENPDTKKCFFDDREAETYHFGYPLSEG